MPVWIKRANAERKPSGCAFGVLKVAAIIVLGFASSAVRAQSGRPQPDVYDPVPDAHKMPTASEMDRMARPNSSIKPPVAAGTPRADTCLLPPLDLIRSPSIVASHLQIEAKAKNEYQKACASVQKKKIADAQKTPPKSTWSVSEVCCGVGYAGASTHPTATSGRGSPGLPSGLYGGDNLRASVPLPGRYCCATERMGRGVAI